MTRIHNLFALLCVAAIVVCGGAALADPAGDQPGWFDCANCDICQPIAERPELMKDMKWEIHKLAGGMLMTTSVPADVKKDYYAMNAEMHANASGAVAKQCGFCAAFGGLVQAGAEVEEVKTDFGMITLVTSGDAAAVAKIHAVADRSTAEMAKMAAAE